MARSFTPSRRAVLAGLLAAPAAAAGASGDPSEIRVDYATYNPLSLIIRERGWMEEALRPHGVAVRWVLSAGSNKALEYLNAGSLDIGSTAGAAALVARLNGQPVKAVGLFSKPEWTALVTRRETGVAAPADLKGRRIAVTRGTDPHIFLVRALAAVGLSEKDVRVIPLQHADGRLALVRGDVDAWSGLDPMMAAAELDNGAVLFHRNPDANTWGVIDVRESFAARHPRLVGAVLSVYERARRHALAKPADLLRALVRDARISETVAARQLERTGFDHPRIGPDQAATILAAGEALRAAGVLAPGADVAAATAALVDASFTPADV